MRQAHPLTSSADFPWRAKREVFDKHRNGFGGPACTISRKCCPLPDTGPGDRHRRPVDSRV